MGEAAMAVIDADAHVIETNATWDYMDPADRKFRPTLVAPEGGAGRERWLIEGKFKGFRFPTLTEKELQHRSEVSGRNVVTPLAARELDDVGLRLADMD